MHRNTGRPASVTLCRGATSRGPKGSSQTSASESAPWRERSPADDARTGSTFSLVSKLWTGPEAASPCLPEIYGPRSGRVRGGAAALCR
jgi:hypothetical protein